MASTSAGKSRLLRMAPGSRSSLVSVRRMPMIHEDEDMAAPALPARSHLRRTWHADARYPMHEYGHPPPPYSQGSDESTPDRKSEPHSDGIKDTEWFAKRGGWYRLTIAALILTALIIGLGVGLTLGLKSRPEDKPPPAQIDIFPAGSYSFTTALKEVSSNCTSNPATFSCYPFATYSPSTPDSSSATFYWILRPLNSYAFAISSSPNPFAPSFTNITTTILDSNQYTERLVFNFTMPLPVLPRTNIVPSQPSAAKCTFPTTVLTATLWTRMRATYPANITAVAAPVNGSDVFAPWPYRIEVEEVQDAGKGVPECNDYQGKSLGDFSVAAGRCGCWYGNYGLGNETAAAAARRWDG